MRTDQEILDRVEAIRPADFLGWTTPVLLMALSYECAVKEEIVANGVDRASWDSSQTTNPTAEAKEYLAFAMDKARNERGISAERSVDKLREWLWLSGDDSLLRRFEGAPYNPYGRRKLAVLCEAWGVKPDMWPND